MGLFDWLFPPKQQEEKPTEEALQAKTYFQTLTAYRPHFTTWGGSIFESELVRAAIDVRARHVSKLKVEIIGKARPELRARLKNRPNSWQTWSQFLYRLSVILDVHNTAIVVPVYDSFMQVIGYYPILPRRVEIVEADGEPWLRYEFKHRQFAAERLSACAILTRFQYKSDFFGTNNEALDPVMKLVHLQNEGIEEAIRNGATFRFMAQMKNFSKAEDLKAERRRFNELNLKSDGETDGGILLFPNTYDQIKQIDSKPYTISDAEQESIKNAVYNYFGVNEDILQSRAYGDRWAAFYESVTEPFAIQFSEAMSACIFSGRERSFGNFVMATSNRLQYMSTAEKLNVSAQLSDRGVLNRDEVREIWNLPPLPDGAGQAYIIRGEYYNADEKINEDPAALPDPEEEERRLLNSPETPEGGQTNAN